MDRCHHITILHAELSAFLHQDTIQKIVEEIAPLLKDRYVGKIFQLGPLSLAIDFGLREGRYLFLSVEPAAPRLYLIKRRIKDLERESSAYGPFLQSMRAILNGARLVNMTKDPSERIIRFSLQIQQPATIVGDSVVLVAQLTGRSANLLLLNQQGTITHTLRPPRGKGQSVGESYKSPPPQAKASANEKSFERLGSGSISAALDAFYRQEGEEKLFLSRANALSSRLSQQIKQKAKLKANLEKDLAAHGDAEHHKRLGDLLLANIATAQRTGSKVWLKDFYTAGTPLIEIDVDQHNSLQDEAQRYFARYTKAKRAAKEIGRRLIQITHETDELMGKRDLLEQIIKARDETALVAFAAAPTSSAKARGVKRTKEAKVPGVRVYKSSDGLDILVGRAARDNDHLTFKLAKPNDLWLHAADYPGSHVIVRRQNRNEIPHRTIIEAAQLAANFSQARKDAKVAIHYTPRKFLSKPRGAAPGLVRMATFKTIVVEPKEAV